MAGIRRGAPPPWIERAPRTAAGSSKRDGPEAVAELRVAVARMESLTGRNKAGNPTLGLLAERQDALVEVIRSLIGVLAATPRRSFP